MRHEFEPDEGLDNIDKYPIHRFSSVGCNDIVKLILVYESVENTPLGKSSVCLLKDMDENTPLHCAAREGKVSVINTLLENCWKCAGVVSDKKNETVLHCALRNNKAKAFKTLLGWYIIKEEFLNNKARDWDCGDTALDLLVDGYEKIVKELLGQRDSKDYIREVTSKITNRKILSLSVNSRSIITLKVLIRSSKLRDILDYVKDVDEKTVLDLLDKTKRTTKVMGFVPYERYENVIRLLDAIEMGDYETFSELQDEDPEILDYFCELPLGGTPLHIAVRSGQLNDCTREIIRKRPDFAVARDHKGRNPIHKASTKGYLEIVKELLTQIGSQQCFARSHEYEDKNLGEFSGTPLCCAIGRGRISVIKELLSVWWDCVGEANKEVNSDLLYCAIDGQLEALKY
ncbi:serine/threonine-protein phosphatase 6 regulatory ankyrin repeat subunit C-like [Papaver somniferum]|uniref:serine/threonine-protein phosphatase 6 regulatory ankyrin repeat subunit C-like n=1 Tax=Papaver somniferum TaxID=3469 RepID=UPI000E7050E7|nr:serine/threonine-protein phosphatase 6 regulatory ankyrin repeat subunit C-like [Papaver somniferum]